jgi:hypothetical protein
MELEQPRGMQEQVAAVTDLLDGKLEDGGDTQTPEETPEEAPEQESPGENLEAGEDEAGDEGKPEEQAEQPTGEINTVAEFAKAAGWEPEDLYALKVRLDTGEEIPLGQMKDALQQAARERAEVAAAKEQIAQRFQQLQQQELQAVQWRQQLSDEVVAAQERVAQAQARYNSVEWEELAQSDPGRAALMQQQIAAEYAGAKRDLEQAFGKQQAMQQQVIMRTVQENNERFLQAVPEWRNPEVAQRESAKLDGFLIEKLGFSPQELSTIYDARSRVVALMALRWFEHATAVKNTATTVRKAPKPVVTPSGQRPAPTQVRKLNSLMQKAKTTRNRDDQVAAVNALLNPR